MERRREIDLENLFSLYELLGKKKDGIFFAELVDFSLISSNQSVWPNIIFGLDNKIITEGVLNKITEKIQNSFIKPQVLLENETTSLVQMRKNGFLPIEQWTGMYHNEFHGKKISRLKKSNINISILADDFPLAEWIRVVSSSLFNNKDLDPSIFIFLKNSGVDLVVARLANMIVGSALIYYDKKESAGIYMVSVAEAYRGQGIAKRIIRFCFECIINKNIDLCVLQSTKQGLALYESFGFKKTVIYNLYLKVK